jgi:hypothetical protein
MGMLMVNFNLLESDLHFALWSLARVNELHTMEMIIGHVRSFRSLIGMFKQLSNQRFKDKRTRLRIKYLAKRLTQTNDRRNSLIHGKWVSVGPKASIIRFQDQKDSANWRQITTSAQQIHDDAIKVIRTHVALRRFIVLVQKRNDRDQKHNKKKGLPVT